MPFKTIRGILVIVGFLFSLSLYATSKDSTKTPTDSISKYYFFSSQFEHLTKRDYTPIDTMLTGFQKYDPAKELYPFRTSLGNIGLANKSMVFNNANAPDFDLGNHSFDSYRFKSENLKYYKGLTPYSDLFYMMGAKKEQYLNVIHNRNLSKNLTIGINYRLVRSLGYYRWQEANNTNAALTSYYTTSNKRYGFIANYVFNRIKADENGGIKPEFLSKFEENTETQREAVDVNLLEGQTRTNNIRESSFYLKQYYCFGFNKTIKTTDSTEEKVFNSLGLISHSIKFDKQAVFYEDNMPKSKFYKNIYMDSTYTFDSLHFKILENKLALSNENNEYVSKKYFLLYNISLTHQLIDINQSVYKPFDRRADMSKASDTTITKMLDSTFSQVILQAEIKTNPEKLISLGINGYKIFGGYNNKDDGMNAYSMINFSDSTEIENFILLKAGYSENEAPWLSQYYYSNHFKWKNDFLKTKTLYTGFNWTYKTLSTQLNYYTLDNIVYYDSLIQPQQHTSTTNILNLLVFKNIKLGKWSIDNTVVYQKVIKGDSVLRFPEFILNHSIYYNGIFFKGALYSQFGIDVSYNSNYYADAYMPGIRDFYIQNTKKIGNYPYVDVFLNFKIQRVRVFLKYQHVNAGLSGYKYYTTPYYPLQDRALKFGLSWIFHN